MKLIKLDYSELDHSETENPWSLKGISFTDFNLIIGKNSTGKSRTIRVIVGLANIISLRAPLTDGSWHVEFVNEDSKKPIKVNYDLTIVSKRVIKEKIVVDGEVKLDRNGKTKIFSFDKSDFIEIEPPDDKLVLHIRRDKKEYNFFEYLIDWAANARGYEFSDVRPGDITIEKDVTTLVRLNTVPQVTEKLEAQTLNTIIEEFNSIGFEIEEIKVNKLSAAPFDVKILEIKEKGIQHFIKQIHLSQGMFRALALLILINYLIEKKETSTILVDDLCEGMDYERATNFAKLILEKMNKAHIQFIATTNDSFLMNVIDIKYWNVLKRVNTVVNAFNDDNSKELFEEFRTTSLNNFDFFASSYYSKLGIKNE